MSKKLIIIIAAVFLLFTGMVGAGFFVLWQKMSATLATATQSTQEEKKEEEPTDKLGPLYSLSTLIVNLSDDGGKRYLRTTLELELSVPEVSEEIVNRLPQIKDTILIILSTKKFNDVNSMEGKIRLRDEIIEKVNTLLTKGQLTNIFFTEFVIQ